MDTGIGPLSLLSDCAGMALGLITPGAPLSASAALGDAGTAAPGAANGVLGD